jgi:hypothetical protein
MARRFLAVTLGLALVGTIASSSAMQVTATPYATFVKLSPEQRRDYWIKATPAAKSQIAQAHATAWLSANEKSLGAAQITSLKESIALLTPAFYDDPTSASGMAQSAALERKLFCAVWKSDVVAAFQPLGSKISVTWMDDVSTWLRKCYLGN